MSPAPESRKGRFPTQSPRRPLPQDGISVRLPSWPPPANDAGKRPRARLHRRYPPPTTLKRPLSSGVSAQNGGSNWPRRAGRGTPRPERARAGGTPACPGGRSSTASRAAARRPEQTRRRASGSAGQTSRSCRQPTCRQPTRGRLRQARSPARRLLPGSQRFPLAQIGWPLHQENILFSSRCLYESYL